MTTRSASAVECVAGPGIVLRGRDIDTDRIIPARFLKAVTFAGLERHVFEDDRAQLRARSEQHAFDAVERRDARVLVAGANFGCGSSREHAPQGLARAGYRAIIGESFSEIFQGNAAMLGLPCFAASHDDVERLQTLIETTPDTVITADVAAGAIVAGGLRVAAILPAALREGFLSGQWNPTAMLLERFEEVRAVAGRLPYITGF